MSSALTYKCGDEDCHALFYVTEEMLSAFGLDNPVPEVLWCPVCGGGDCHAEGPPNVRIVFNADRTTPAENVAAMKRGETLEVTFNNEEAG